MHSFAVSTPVESQRIDKWLWCARIYKTRALAAKAAASGAVRLTRGAATSRVEKASVLVRPGDRLAFLAGGRLRILEIEAIASRRGPAAEARQLYRDRSAPPADLARQEVSPCSTG